MSVEKRAGSVAASGWINGLIGVVIFSGSLPATRLAVADFSPLTLTVARAAIAGILGLLLLVIFRQPKPARQQLWSLLVVAAGVVIGFPLLTALAVQQVTAAHSIVFLGLLPLATAACGVLRGGERPGGLFWVFAVAGSLLVAGFAASQTAGLPGRGDLLMLGAIVLCAIGYAEGARLTRTLGGWQVISWALVIALPLMILLLIFLWPANLAAVSPRGWFALSYVALFSMLIGFIFWYRGLAQGGIAAVGQLQLLQPLLGLGLSATLLGEAVSPEMLLVSLGVILCVGWAKKCASPQAAR
ncbi:DMT family transporter [Shimwellia pseudoproteus]|uniref:DMT family transporter n=1 Tax=Shimwellia pseudoproteus TaxID=570012 RepID=UPI0018EDC6C0|nr:DMT family transporter [Shimwellia pseudoproteus]MBJ3816963.1 DMT family transporter [Shimwellia pseudoproteus]